MGDPKKQRKKFDRPLRAWNKARIEAERELVKNFGLKRKKELWRVESHLRNIRRQARNLLAKKDEVRKNELLDKLNRMGLVEKNAKLEDVLALKTENLLERRLQTLVFKKGLANTTKQARQLIVHGHVRVGGRTITWPNCLVPLEEEKGVTCDLKVDKTKPKATKKGIER